MGDYLSRTQFHSSNADRSLKSTTSKLIGRSRIGRAHGPAVVSRKVSDDVGAALGRCGASKSS
jgi:hypothetical protein